MNGMQSSSMAATMLADTTELNTDLVTPGVLGFVIIFVIALALYFLMRNMTGKLSQVRGEQEEDLASRREKKAGHTVPVDGSADSEAASEAASGSADSEAASETAASAASTEGSAESNEAGAGEDSGSAGR